MKRVLEHLPILEYLSKLSPKEQKLMIKGAPKELLFLFSEICLNLIKRNIPLEKNQIIKLRKFENQIISLTQKKHSLGKRRAILHGGSFLKHLIDETLPPLLVSCLKKGRSKKQNGNNGRASEKEMGKEDVSH